MTTPAPEGLLAPELVTVGNVLGLNSFFSSSTFSDITIVGPDGRKIPCHQVVLAAGSKRLAAVLSSGNLSGEELPVRGVDAEGLEAVLKFLYSGECNLDYKTVIPVYDAAHRLNVPSLVQACEAFSGKALGIQTACTLLQAALQFNMHAYGDQCMEVVRSNYPSVMVTQDFLTMAQSTLTRVLADTALCASQPPATLFTGAWRWATSRPSRLKLLPELLQAVQGAEGLSADEVAAMCRVAAGETKQEDDEPAVPSFPAQVQQLVGQAMSEGANLEGAIVRLLASSLTQQLDAETPASASRDAAAAAAEATPADAGASVGLDASLPAGSVSLTGNGAAPELAAVQALQAGLPGSGSDGKGGLMPLGGLMSLGGSGSNTPLGDSFNPNQPLSLPLQPMSFPNMSLGGLFMGGDGSAPGSNGAGSSLSGLDPNSLSTAGLPPALADLLRQHQQQEALQAALAAVTATNNSMGLSGLGGDVPMGMGLGGDGSMQSGPSRGGGGGASGRSSYGNKGVCQVEGCGADLAGLREYHMRYKICEYHLKIPQIMRDGVPQRFCQQCGRFHNLDQFDGDKRSCRARLHKHNARRRKRAGESEWDDQQGMGRQRPRLEDPNLLAATNAAALTSALNPLMAMAAAAAAASSDRNNPLMNLAGLQPSTLAAITAMASRLAGGAGGADGLGGLGDMTGAMGDLGAMPTMPTDQ